MQVSLQPVLRFVQKHLVAASVVGSMIVLLVGLFSYILPHYRTVQSLGGLNYKQKQQSLADAQQYLQDLRALQKQVNAIAPDDLARLDAVLPRQKDVPGIFKQMQVFAKAVNMDLSTVSVADGGALGGAAGTSAGVLRTLNISVVLAGTLDYEGLKGFLATLAQQAPVLDLTAITYSPASSSATASYSFTFRSYYIGT